MATLNWEFYARTIVEEPRVSAIIDGPAKDLYGFCEAYEALKWLLARRCASIPHIGRTATNGILYNLYAQARDPLANTPRIVILYTYDEKNVNIVGIKATQ